MHAVKGTTAVIVYVVDIVIIGDDSEEVQHLKSHLSGELEVKDLGTLHYFLGIEVARSRKGIFISQRKYILDLLTETRLLGAKPAEIPIEVDHGLNDQDGRPLIDAGRYQWLVGKLIYLALTWAELAFAVGVVSQFMHAPRTPHLEANFRVHRYLKLALGRDLMFSKNGHMHIEVYIDVDWVGFTDRPSTSMATCTLNCWWYSCDME